MVKDREAWHTAACVDRTESTMLHSDLKQRLRDFPGGPVVKNLPGNAGDMGSMPGQGTEIPLASGQLSLCTATTEAACSGTRVPPPESSCTVMKTPPAACKT